MSEIPDNLGYTEDHEWVGPDEGNGVKVGITDYAQDSLSDVVFVECVYLKMAVLDHVLFVLQIFLILTQI